jgi:aminoglycoside phosphotransferase (APT) family kinase protein
VHGDLSPEHVLCDDAGRAVGVLDFSGPQVSDAALDFGRLVQHWGVRFATTVLERYDRPTDDEFSERMLAYARLEPLRTIEAGVLRELPLWVVWGQRHLAAAAAARSRRARVT